MKNTKNQQKREEARELFYNQGLSIRELAVRYGKCERTIYRWLHEDNQETSGNQQPNIMTQSNRRKYPPEIFTLIEKLKQEVPQRSAPTIKELVRKRFPNKRRSSCRRLIIKSCLIF